MKCEEAEKAVTELVRLGVVHRTHAGNAYNLIKRLVQPKIEALKEIKDIMGGDSGVEGWSSPEDVWKLADEALKNE